MQTVNPRRRVDGTIGRRRNSGYLCRPIIKAALPPLLPRLRGYRFRDKGLEQEQQQRGGIRIWVPLI